jgi:RimJ/RimL family protein N-acetyltransferase
VSSEISLAEKPTLTGERVLLRPVCAADAAGFAAVGAEALRLTGTHRTHSIDVLEAWFASRGEQRDRLDLAIIERETGELVGEVVLMDFDAGNRSSAFRIALLHSGVFNRGLGTEATRLVLAHAFDTVGLHRVELEVFAHNPRARHVYEKVGFVYEGTKREALGWDAAWIDVHVMAMLAHEWAEHRGNAVAGSD